MGIFERIIVLISLLFVFSYSSLSEVIRDIKTFSFPKRTGKEVLVLVSDKISTFEEVDNGIAESLKGYNVYSYNFQGDTNSMDDVPEIVSRLKPNVVVVLGASIFEKIVGKTDIPIVFSMVINYKKFDIEKYKNIAGVSLQIPPESVFFNLKTIYPNFRKVGVICSKDYFDSYIKPSVDSLKISLDVEVISSIIQSSKDFVSAYNNISKNADVMWMVPDTAVLDKNSIIFFITESFKRQKPSVVYSEPFVKAGGFFSVSPDYNSIGSQIALIVRRIVEDKSTPNKIGIVPVVGTFVTVNREISKKLGISEDILSLVDKVIE
ncbi:MAG: ABC transporter substrate binding protein [Spirochaetia bacterium]|nr:hypothetical protein [Spirochaetota bacterium]MCX8096804.1 hypothetical protein [Spirochaetota bacterium]MDW8112185.1 ABC transporter substrate binding protein [Spirochaetia bacterium]